MALYKFSFNVNVAGGGQAAYQSGYGGYYAVFVVGVHTATTSADFEATASNCIAELCVYSGKTYYVNGPYASNTMPTVYFKFEPKALFHTYSTFTEIKQTTTYSGVKNITINISYSYNDAIGPKYLDNLVVNTLCQRGFTTANHYAIKNSPSSPTANQPLVKKEDILWYLPVLDSSSNMYIYEDGGQCYYVLDYTDNRYILHDNYWRFKLVNPYNMPSNGDAIEDCLQDHFWFGQQNYSGGLLSANSYSSPVCLTTKSCPVDSYALRNSSTYDYYLGLRGFQRWHYMQLRIIYVSKSLIQADTTPIVGLDATITYTARAQSSGTTATTFVGTVAANSAMTCWNASKGQQYYCYAFARKSNTANTYPDGDWIRMSATTSVFTLGNSYSSFPTVYVEFPEENKTIQINGLFQVTSIPAHATHYIGVQVTYQIKYGSSASTDYTSQTATITGTIGSSTSTAQMNHTIATDKSFSVKERYYYANVWVHVTNVKYQKASGGSWYTATISDTSYYQITNGSISTAAFKPVASITWAALQ